MAEAAELQVAVFSVRLLPTSETFVREQGEHLPSARAHYLGCRRVPGLELPEDRLLLVNGGGPLGLARELAFRRWGLAPAAARELRRRRIELLHAHFGLGGAVVLPFCRRTSMPLVVTFHGADATVRDAEARRLSPTHRLFLGRRDALFRQADLLIAVSDFIRARLLELGAPPERLVRHAIGVDSSAFRPGDGPRQRTVLFVGRLVPKKGCDLLLRAMAGLAAEGSDLDLAVIGDGPLRPELERLAAELGAPARFLGSRPPEDVRAWMRRARLLAAPSRTAASGDSEGLPITILEAQASGLPVVASRHAGIPEAVIDGESGLLVAEDDVGGLAAAIRDLDREDELWRRCAAAGRRSIEERFDLDRQCARLEELYRGVLERRRRERACAS